MSGLVGFVGDKERRVRCAMRSGCFIVRRFLGEASACEIAGLMLRVRLLVW